jgi:excisionase family DNA binding protein
MEDRWLSVDEIAKYLGVRRDTIYRWINDKGMPAHKIGRLWKFKKDQVDAWVEAGCAASHITDMGRKSTTNNETKNTNTAS